MIILHHLNNSRSQRILWVLEELEIPYEIKFYQRGADHLAPKELRDVHPLGKSPVITDTDRGNKVVAESGAIINYLIKYHPSSVLYPPYPEHGRKPGPPSSDRPRLGCHDQAVR